jgi:hypothetical protein
MYADLVKQAHGAAAQHAAASKIGPSAGPPFQAIHSCQLACYRKLGSLLQSLQSWINGLPLTCQQRNKTMWPLQMGCYTATHPAQ